MVFWNIVLAPLMFITGVKCMRKNQRNSEHSFLWETGVLLLCLLKNHVYIKFAAYDKCKNLLPVTDDGDVMCNTFPLGGLLPEPISKSYLSCDQLDANKGFPEVTSDTQHFSCSPSLLFKGAGFFPESAGIFTLDYRLCNGTTWSPFISLNLTGNAQKQNFSAFAFFVVVDYLFFLYMDFLFCVLRILFCRVFSLPFNSDNIMGVYAISSYSDSYPFSLHPWFVFSYSYSP